MLASERVDEGRRKRGKSEDERLATTYYHLCNIRYWLTLHLYCNVYNIETQRRQGESHCARKIANMAEAMFEHQRSMPIAGQSRVRHRSRKGSMGWVKQHQPISRVIRIQILKLASSTMIIPNAQCQHANSTSFWRCPLT